MTTAVVAFGGGHGLAASLRAMRLLRSRIDLDITAIVTVGDDGGSSGRLRAERGGLPPGDLRQALAALADLTDPVAERTAELLQFRFGGSDPLGGHAVGNLLLCGLMELYRDPVAGLDHAGDLVRAVGRVLPMSTLPVDIEASIHLPDASPAAEDGRLASSPTAEDGRLASSPTADRLTVRGQHAVAVTRGVVEEVRISPTEPPACTEAIAAIGSADWLVFGPGSWFTSVIPHLLVPDIAAAIAASPARRLVTLNLVAEKETASLSQPDHLRALARYLPGPRVDVVLADAKALDDPIGLQTAAESLGARMVVAPVAVVDGGPRHDPVALAAALHEVLGTEGPMR